MTLVIEPITGGEKVSKHGHNLLSSWPSGWLGTVAEQGSADYTRGRLEGENPYPSRSVRGAAWSMGWLLCRQVERDHKVSPIDAHLLIVWGGCARKLRTAEHRRKWVNRLELRRKPA